MSPGAGEPGSAGPAAPIGRVAWGRSGLTVSTVGLGASALGGVFGTVSDDDGVATVGAALAAGIVLLDTAPAYGATRSERVLGMALRGVPRSDYVISTKAGKTTDGDGRDRFDFSEDGLRRSVDASARRLGVDVIDVVHLHDFDYEAGIHVDAALDAGFRTLHALKAEGRIRAVGAGIYRVDLWKRVLLEADLDVILLHNHHNLCDLRAYELLPLTEARGIGVINAAPFASGLLTGGEAPPWHPAPPAARQAFAAAARLAAEAGVPIARLALAFAASEPRLPVTLFSCAHPETLRRNLSWLGDPVDRRLVAAVQVALEPVMNRQWAYDAQPAMSAPAMPDRPEPPGGAT
jgi:L-galactose dehydrogenase